jgi:hypothetical protein
LLADCDEDHLQTKGRRENLGMKNSSKEMMSVVVMNVSWNNQSRCM